jgi:O-antigen ligase
LLAEVSEDRLRRLIYLLILTGVLAATRAMILYVQGAGSVGTYTEGAVRIMSVSVNCMLVSLAVSISFAATGTRPWLFLLASLSLAAGLVVTFQRAALLGVLGALVALFASLRGAQRWRFVTGAFGVTCLAGVAIGMGEVADIDTNIVSATLTRVESIAQFREDVSAGHRLREWNRAWDMIRQHPIVGNGLGAEVVFDSPMYDEVHRRMGFRSHDVYMHNSYLWLLVKTGLVGLLLVCGLLWLAVQKVVLSVRTPGLRVPANLVIGLGSALAAQLVVAFFGPMLNVDDAVPFSVLIIGGLLGLGALSSLGQSKLVTGSAGVGFTG